MILVAPPDSEIRRKAIDEGMITLVSSGLRKVKMASRPSKKSCAKLVK